MYVNYFYGSTFFISFHHEARQIPASLEFFLCSSAYQFLELPWLSIIICLHLFHSVPSQFTACHTCSHLPPPTLHCVSFTPHTSLCSFSVCLATSDSLDCRIWGAAYLKNKTLKHKLPNLLFPMLMPSPFLVFLQSHRVCSLPSKAPTYGSNARWKEAIYRVAAIMMRVTWTVNENINFCGKEPVLRPGLEYQN